MAALLRWVIGALVLLLVAQIVPGIEVANLMAALIAAAVFGLVNLLIKPLVTILTLPINLLTFGLFSFVINALMFGLTAWLVPGFEVNSFLSALLGSLLLSLITTLGEQLISRPLWR